MRKIMMTLAAGRLVLTIFFCCAMTTGVFTACDKLEEEGMNDVAAFYSYRAFSNDFDYSDAAGPFDTAIRFSVGMDPIQGGDDAKVIEACDECYESLKPRLSGRSGKVIIYKTRHPDGKQKNLKVYKF